MGFDAATLVTYDVNLYRIGGITRVAVRWICSSFLQGFAPTSRQLPPYIRRIDRVIGFRHGSDTIPFKRCCRYIVFLARSSVVSQIFFANAVFSVCGARVVIAYYTPNRFIHLTSPDTTLYFQSTSKSLCYSVNDVHRLSSKS